MVQIMSKKVLIIDDSVDTVEMLEMILKDEGYDVIIAYVGEIGVKKAKEENPDLIILDVMLPGIDGFQVCEKIKSDPDTKDIPIIMLTGKDMGDDFDKAADCYIKKPYDIEHLLKVFDKLLRVKSER